MEDSVEGAMGGTALVVEDDKMDLFGEIGDMFGALGPAFSVGEAREANKVL